MRLKGRAQELLPRFKTVDLPRSKTPFRENPVPHYQGPGIMESHVSGPFHPPGALHKRLVHWLLSGRHSRRNRRGLLGIGFFSRRALEDGYPRGGLLRADINLPCPIPRILARVEVPPCGIYRPHTLTDFRPLKFIASSRRPLRDRSLSRPDQEQ